MPKAIILLASLALLTACTSSKKNEQGSQQCPVRQDTAQRSGKAAGTVSNRTGEAGETLVYGDPAIFATYTEDKMHGSGVISFEFDINNRLDIFYPDESTFGFMVLNEDQTFYTLDMPAKLIARQVVPEYDFARFDFDAEAVNTNKDYLIIYANKQKLMVKKNSIKYRFRTWEDYIRSQHIQLKSGNFLTGAAGYPDLLFDVTELKGDSIKIKSASKDCMGPDVKFKQLTGWLRWKQGENLLVDFGDCE